MTNIENFNLLSIILVQLMLVYIWMKTLHNAHMHVENDTNSSSLIQILLWDSFTISYKLMIMTCVILITLVIIFFAINVLKGFDVDKEHDNENESNMFKRFYKVVLTNFNYYNIYHLITNIAFNFTAALINDIFAIFIIVIYQQYIMSKDDFKNKQYMHMHIDIVMFMILFFDCLIFFGVFIKQINKTKEM